MSDVRAEVLAVVAEAYDNRLKPRLAGLTDEEYLWEPVPDCWTVHPRDDGVVTVDWGLVWDEAPPFTTIAWRMVHLIGCYGGRRTASWLGLEERPNPLEDGVPATAAAALDMLERAHDTFVAYVGEIEEAELWTKIGPIGGQYADATKLGLVMHQLDEVVHHGAEISLLRDLYRAQQPQDPFVVACLRADRDAVERLRRDDPGTVDRARGEHPTLMLRAAERGRWDAIDLLAELGFPVEGPTGRGPLHHAAGAGNVAAVRRLLELGADPAAKDPTYDQTPLGWAHYFGQRETARYLSAEAGGSG